MSPLPSTLTNTARSRQPFLLLQSSTAQSCVSLIRYLIREARSNASGTTLLFCLLYSPWTFVETTPSGSDDVRVFDWTENVPGYVDQPLDIKEEILNSIRSAPAGPLNVIVDSVDTLLSDLDSLSKTEKVLSGVLSSLCSRNDGSRLLLHVLAPSPLIPALIQTKFSPSITHITAHPTALLTHLAGAYLMPPPPLSTPEKFWRVFLPIVERHYEAEKLVFGPNGDGSGGQEFVVEVLIRGADGSGRRRGVERMLEGWSGEAPCGLNELIGLKGLWTRKIVPESGPDPTQNLSFNLNLTPEQQQSRAQVPLPYVHEGKSAEQEIAPRPAAILYDPDSADDIDDDDPDEDLDI